MSIPILVEVSDEVRRLAIAGSVVAPGDFRLKKLISPLEKAGEKAPVFAKVAQSVQAVVDSQEKTASTALLELTTLVNAILYTQGETGIAGDLQPIETTNLGGQHTQTSARVLKPLLEALSTTGSGRMELIRDAFDRGAFRDMRLVRPALKALDDPYPEIADFVSDRVLPLYGAAILPELRGQFDIKGKGGHVRRLRLMHQLDPAGARDLVQRVLDEGSKELKVAAVEFLGDSGDDLTYLLDQVKAKAKDVRTAALKALANLKAVTTDVFGALKKAITGPDLEPLISRLQRTTVPEVLSFLLEQADGHLAAAKKTKDKKQQGAEVTRLMYLLCCLDERTDPAAESFLLRYFDQAAEIEKIKADPGGDDVNELVAYLLAQATPKTRQRLLDSQKTLSGSRLGSAMFSARVNLTPEKFYESFGSDLKPLSAKHTKKTAPEFGRATQLLQVLTNDGRHSYSCPWGVRISRDESSPPLSLPDLDPRWLDAAVEADESDLVYQLARPGHAGANQFLSAEFAELRKKKERFDIHRVLETMVRVQHPQAVDSVLEWLEQQAKATHHGYYGYWMSPIVSGLPKSALPKLEALMTTLPDKVVEQLMDSVLALKNKPD